MLPLSNYQADHLLLLVGGNPLPNAVAGKLLVAPGGTVTLVHSRDTLDVAQKLEKWLCAQKNVNLESMKLKEVEESNPASVFDCVQERLEAFRAQHVGLNYTGGTKVMSVHAYRAIEKWMEAKKGKGEETTLIFSYLDARTLRMNIDPVCGRHGHTEYVGRALQFTLTDLLELHGWTLKHSPTTEPVLPDSARELAQVCADEAAFRGWQQWAKNELRGRCRRSDKDDWKTRTQIQSVRLSWPRDQSLNRVVQSLQSELRTPADEFGLTHATFDNEPKRCCEWLDGKWLEHHVLGELNGLAGSLYLHERAENIVPNEIEFDLDVLALRGYQLFAFSCSTDTHKSLLKFKLFEAYVRARQLGGDEARVALICCFDDPDRLQQEMTRDIDPEGRIRVFGRKHLGNLCVHLTEWIQSQKGVE